MGSYDAVSWAAPFPGVGLTPTPSLALAAPLVPSSMNLSGPPGTTALSPHFTAKRPVPILRFMTVWAHANGA